MKTEKKYKKGDTVYIKHANFGKATIIDNGRKWTFNHSQTIYKVQNESGKVERYNEIHFSPITTQTVKQ